MIMGYQKDLDAAAEAKDVAKMKEQSALHHASAANHDDTSAGERADQDAESSDSAAAFSASAFHRGSSADIELKHSNLLQHQPDT